MIITIIIKIEKVATLSNILKGLFDMNNLEIRTAIKQKRLYHYEVAEKLGITEITFCRWLRKELSSEQKQKVLSAINELTTGKS